jgi:hypothetical protein
MGLQTIGTIFGVSATLTALSFWLHGRLAKPEGRPGATSMGAFVLGWSGALPALLTGAFLLMVAVSG